MHPSSARDNDLYCPRPQKISPTKIGDAPAVGKEKELVTHHPWKEPERERRGKEGGKKREEEQKEVEEPRDYIRPLNA